MIKVGILLGEEMWVGIGHRVGVGWFGLETQDRIGDDQKL